MSYSYSTFGSLLSNAGNDSLRAFQNNSKYMNALKSISTKNTFTDSNHGFDTISIFNIGFQGQTGSYTGLHSNMSSGNLEKNFWSLVGSYTGPANNASASNNPANNTNPQITKLNTTPKTNNILAAASSHSVSDLISLLPKAGSLFNNNNNSGKMSSFFA